VARDFRWQAAVHKMPEHAPPSKGQSADCRNCATRSCCPLGGLPLTTLDALDPLISKKRFQRDEVLSREGEFATSLKVIKLGIVFQARTGRDGSTRPLGIAGRGAVFGLPGFFRHTNLVSGIAASPGRVCEMSLDGLREQALIHPELHGLLLSETAKAMKALASWSEGMRLRGAVNQLAYALLLLSEAQDNPVVDLPTHTALAELIGSTRETIVRGLTVLESEGIICRLERKKCLVLQAPLLARLRTGGDRSQAA